MLFDDVNEVRLMGNITNDPDLRFTPSGTAVLNFGLATNRRFKDGDEWKDDTTFHNIVAWAQLAQSAGQRIHKGTKVLVSGRLQVRTWDGNDGKKQYKTEVVADNIILIARYNEGAANDLPSVSPDVSGKTAKSSTKPEETSQAQEETINPDDLPF